MENKEYENAVIIHGTCDEAEYFDPKFPSLSNSHWLPWLQKQLLIRGIEAQTPEMPVAYFPNYEAWSEELDKYNLNANSILIGHSCGAGFLLRYLSEKKISIAKLILVAPWLDPEKEKDPQFFEFEIDKDLASRVQQIHLLYSVNDMGSVLKSVETIKSNISGLTVKEFKFHGHFTYGEMRTTRFPELLSICTSKEPRFIKPQSESLFSNILASILNFLKTQ